MMRITTSSGFAACVLCAATIQAAATVDNDAEELFFHGSLVEARVLVATRHDGWYQAKFEILHVFKGDLNLRGKSFEFKLVASGTSRRGAPSVAWPVRPGERMIWLLQQEKEGVGWVKFGPSMKHTGAGNLTLPVRESDREPSSYEDVLAWAGAVEAAVRTEPANRTARAKELLESKSPLLWELGLGLLGAVNPKEAMQVYPKLMRRRDLSSDQVDEVRRALRALERFLELHPGGLDK